MPPVNLDIHVGSIAKLAAIIFPIYLGVKIIYNIWFHPLRNFPGPFWHRATILAYCLKLARGTLAYDVAAFHEKYGPVVRIGPGHLSFTDAEAWKDIYGHRTGSHAGMDEMPKSSVFYSLRGVPRSIINETRENHTVLRRQLAHGFSDRSMRLQEPIIGSYVDLLIRRLREHCYEPAAPGAEERRHAVIDIKNWINWTTFDIIGDLAFGEPFGCLEEAYEHPWVGNVNGTVRVFGPMQALKLLGGEWIVAAIVKLGLSRSRQQHMDRTREKLARRVQLTMERPDLIEGLLRVKNLDLERTRINASTLIIAGSETTATLLSGAVYLLLSNPDKLERLKAEVRSTFKDDAEITLSSVASLTYMLACLDESLRRYPPVAIGMPRVVPAGGANIAGSVVPENTVVAVWQQACYQSERNFEDPLAFKPERWLHQAGVESRDKLEAMQAFSVGPRNCIGKNLAYAEMRLILAKLLFNFDIELIDKSQDWLKHPVYVLRDKPALNVYLTPVFH